MSRAREERSTLNVGVVGRTIRGPFVNSVMTGVAAKLDNVVDVIVTVGPVDCEKGWNSRRVEFATLDGLYYGTCDVDFIIPYSPLELLAREGA